MKPLESTTADDNYRTFCPCDVCNHERLFIQQGWECPKCGLINAPFMSCCPCSTMKRTCSGSTKNSHASEECCKNQEPAIVPTVFVTKKSDGEEESEV